MALVYMLRLHSSECTKIDDCHSRRVGTEVVFSFALKCFSADLGLTCGGRGNSAVSATMKRVNSRSDFSKRKLTARIECEVLCEKSGSGAKEQNKDIRTWSRPAEQTGVHRPLLG